MYFSQVYSYASPYVWFTAALLVVMLVYVLEQFRRRAIVNEAKHQVTKDSGAAYSNSTLGGTNNGINLVECSSPNCIRCNKNIDILQRARQRLSFYFVPSDNHEMKNDVSNLTEDLKESLNGRPITSRCRSSSRSRSGLSDLQEDHIRGHQLVNVNRSTPTVFFMRGLRENPFFEKEEFPGLDKLDDREWERIRLEFLHLYQSPLPETKSLWTQNTTGSGKWELSLLVNQGRITKAGELCPLTMSFLNHLPSFMNSNLFGNAAFSVVYPQTEIAEHCGSTNFRIRSHLGLQVSSESSCKLTVNAIDVEWKERDFVCFNDAFPHSVCHKGVEKSSLRAVLLIDLWHPDISESQRKLLDYIFSPSP